MKKTTMARVAAALALGLGWGAVGAQSFPAKPVRFVVGFPPGGPADFTARLLAEKVPSLLGGNAIVDNRVGANATIAADHVAKAAPDGYTVFLTTAGAVSISPHIGPKLGYDPVRDLTPISHVVTAHSTLAVHPSMPVKNARDYVQLARTRKGQVALASSGVGSIPHLALELLKASAGIEIVHVPYKGAAPAINETMGGQVTSVIMDVTPLLPHLRAGRLRPVAIAGDKRVAVLPDVATMEEQGYRNVEAPNWYAVFAPAKLPRDLVERLNDFVRKAMAAPDLRERLAATGADPVSSTPEQLAELLRRDLAKWGKLIRDNNIRE